MAEVLITLGIIGVVAAITLPTLVEKHKVRTTVVKLKKMNSILSQAYLMYLRENEPFATTATSEDAVKVFNLFKPYLKILTDCGTSTGEACIYTGDYLQKNGSVHTNPYSHPMYYKVLLADGSALFMRGNNGNFWIDVFYDINGKKGPNRWGYDLFEFLVYKDRVLANGGLSPITGVASFDTSCGPEDGKGFGCAAWVIYNENMDYLKCTDLSWNGKQKCD